MDSIENRHSDIQSKIKSSEDEVISTKTRLQDGHSKIEKLLSEMTSLKEFINSELATQRTNVRSNIDELEDKLRIVFDFFVSIFDKLKFSMNRYFRAVRFLDELNFSMNSNFREMKIFDKRLVFGDFSKLLKTISIDV